MNPKSINKESYLTPFNEKASWSQNILDLQLQQMATWKLADKNYRDLTQVKQRTIMIDQFTVTLQHNPNRIQSTAAKTDKASIASRPCFLCLHRLPSQQKGLQIEGEYLLLINPFPIFPTHLTIGALEHQPQAIENRIPDFLSIAKQLEEFTIFYNGPQCGASAPDHFHFQAVKNNVFPVLNHHENFHIISKNKRKVTLQLLHNGFIKYFRIAGEKKETVIHYLKILINKLPTAGEEEPLMNLMCNFSNNCYSLVLFPRLKHKTDCYYGKGGREIVIGAATVEMGGILVLPREKDYTSISAKEIAQIYTEVLLPMETLLKIFSEIELT